MMGCIARPPTKPYFPISDMRDRHSTKLRWTIFALTILVWILSVVAVADCTFVRIGPRNVQYRNLDDIGLFNFNVDTEGHRCLAYESSVEHDAATKTAQAFACLATIFSGFAMLKVVALQLFLRWKPARVWQMIRVEVLVATISQAIVFAGFATDICVDNPNNKCLPGPAGIINAINILLLCVLSWLCWGMAPPNNPIFEVKLMPTEQSYDDGGPPASSTDRLSTDTVYEQEPVHANRDPAQRLSPVHEQEPDDEWNITIQRSSIDEEAGRNSAFYDGNDSYTGVTLNSIPEQETQTPNMTMQASPVEMDSVGQYLSTQYRDYEGQERYVPSQPTESERHEHRHHKKHKHHSHAHTSRPVAE